MPLIIRPTTSADIKDFIDETFHEHYTKMAGSRCDDRSIMLEAVSGDAPHRRLGALSGDYWWGGAMIGRLVVAPECRKGGVGSKLIKRALSDLRKLGANVAYVGELATPRLLLARVDSRIAASLQRLHHLAPIPPVQRRSTSRPPSITSGMASRSTSSVRGSQRGAFFTTSAGH